MTKNCIRCGADNPLAYQRERKFCSKDCSHADWIEKNPDRRKEHLKTYDSNPDNQQKAKKWREDNKEHLRVESHRRYAANRHSVIARSAVFAAENPDKVRGYKQTYAETPRGKEKAHEGVWRRIARKRASPGSFTKSEFMAMCRNVDWRCLACLKKFAVLEADHVVPLAKGGSNDIGNIQPLCRSCNAGKGASYRDYRAEFVCQPVDLLEMNP